MTSPRPPRLAELLAGALMPAEYRAEHLGDLSEGFSRLSSDLRAARRWYWRQAVRSILPALRMRIRAWRSTDRTAVSPMHTFKQDLVYGLRALARSRTFAAVAVLTLALAIGVNTSIFSLVNVVVFADLPMNGLDSATLVRTRNPSLGIDQGSVSVPDYLDLVERAQGFQSFSAMTEDQWVLTGADVPTRVVGYRITANLLDVWQLPPVLGRGFAAGDDLPGAAPTVMLSHAFWQSQFGGDPAVLGSTIRLDGIEHTVVGVMDPKIGFAELGFAQVWAPLSLSRSEAARDARNLFVVGRLREGVSQVRGTEEVASISHALESQYPESNVGWALYSAPVREALLGDEGQIILLMLILTVAFVMLIACANLANMLLARSTVRAREFAVRTALGAPRGRIIRQLLTESLVLSIAASLVGVLFALGLNRALVSISRGQEALFMMAKLDGRVLSFIVGIALVAPVLFGLLPAVKAAAPDVSTRLRDGRSGGEGRSGKRARNVLVSAQVALALSLMVVAGLLARTVYNSETRTQGFVRDGVLAAELDLPENEYQTDDARREFYRRALENIGALPSISEVALISAIPGAEFGALRGMEIEGREIATDQPRPSVLQVTTSPGAFALLQVPLRSGRDFDTRDQPDTPPVAILAAEVARRYWPESDPVGQRIRFGMDASAPWITVIGIVEDVLSTSPEEEFAEHVYLPYAQNARTGMRVLARAPRDPTVLSDAVRSAIWNVDPNQPIDQVRTVTQAQYANSASSYALISLFVSFAVFALLMAALGIYGVMSYMVSQRRAEIGLRMALGAEVGAVHRMILAQGGRLLAGGLIVGLLLSLGLSRMLRSVVYGISATDPATFIGVAGVLTGVALLANYVPARRATRSDPVTALRAE